MLPRHKDVAMHKVFVIMTDPLALGFLTAIGVVVILVGLDFLREARKDEERPPWMIR